LTSDVDLMDAAAVIEGEQVRIVDITNGAGPVTDAIVGERGSGDELRQVVAEPIDEDPGTVDPEEWTRLLQEHREAWSVAAQIEIEGSDSDPRPGVRPRPPAARTHLHLHLDVDMIAEDERLAAVAADVSAMSDADSATEPATGGAS